MWKVSFITSFPKPTFPVIRSWTPGTERPLPTALGLFLLCSSSRGTEQQNAQTSALNKISQEKKSDLPHQEMKHDAECGSTQKGTAWGMTETLCCGQGMRSSDGNSAVMCLAGKGRGEWMQLYQQLFPLVGYIHKASFTG